jgi:MoxR-like ATPase
VTVSDAVYAYVVAIAAASRTHPRVSLGLSTRGALALLRAARVHAGLRNVDFVAPDDVQAVARWVLAHRLVLKPEAALDGDTDVGVVGSILEATAVPR